jgi:hypothetical protein
MVDELQRLRDNRQAWKNYALDQIATVKQVATDFDGLNIHPWPDDELVRLTEDQLRSKLESMQQAVAPESFPGAETESTDSVGPIEISRQKWI